MYELMNNSGDDAEKYLLDVKNMSDEEFQNNIIRFEQQFGYAEGDRNSERAVMRYIETDEEKGKRYQCLFYEFEGNTLYGVTAYFSKEYEDEEVMELLRTIDFKFE